MKLVSLNQSRFVRHCGRLYAIGHVQRFEDGGHVDFDGLLGDPERPTDFLVRTPLAKPAAHRFVGWLSSHRGAVTRTKFGRVKIGSLS